MSSHQLGETARPCQSWRHRKPCHQFGVTGLFPAPEVADLTAHPACRLSSSRSARLRPLREERLEFAGNFASGCNAASCGPSSRVCAWSGLCVASARLSKGMEGWARVGEGGQRCARMPPICAPLGGSQQPVTRAAEGGGKTLWTLLANFPATSGVCWRQNARLGVLLATVVWPTTPCSVPGTLAGAPPSCWKGPEALLGY